LSGLEPLPETPRGLRRTALALYLLAALVRLTLLFGFGRYEIARPEPVRIAVSLARNGTFADPYLIPTGPTAHAPPSYPFLIAPIYRILGDTPSADMVRLWLSVLTGSAEYALLPYASASLGMGAVVGALAGLAGAVIPLHYWPESMGEFESHGRPCSCNCRSSGSPAGCGTRGPPAGDSAPGSGGGGGFWERPTFCRFSAGSR